MVLAAGQSMLWRSAALGLIFITLGSCRVLLIKFSANEDGKYEYLPVTVNMCAEVIKLLACIALTTHDFCSKGYKWQDIPRPTKHDILPILKWAVPGFLYFIDNLLAFYVLKHLQPAVAVLLGNFGIVTTSVLFRIILKRKLTRIQWASLLILFLAIICLSNQSQGSITIEHHKHHAVNHLVPEEPAPSDPAHHLQPPITPKDLCQAEDTQFQISNTTSERGIFESFHFSDRGGPDPWKLIQLHRGHVLILIQCIIGSFANVYIEKIFKEGNAVEENFYLQNCKLYAFGVFFNMMGLVTHGVYRQKLATCGFFFGHNTFSIILMFITAIFGLSVALILKFRDNMFHLLSAQLITVIVISSSIYFFHFKPRLEFYMTAPIVLASIYIYQMSKQKEEQPQLIMAERQRVRFMHDVDEGDGFIISQNPLQE